MGGLNQRAVLVSGGRVGKRCVSERCFFLLGITVQHREAGLEDLFRALVVLFGEGCRSCRGGL